MSKISILEDCSCGGHFNIEFDNVTEKFVALMLDYWNSLPRYLKMWYRIKAVPLVVANKAVKFWRWLTKEEQWLSN